jgi:hypothetical protein
LGWFWNGFWMVLGCFWMVFGWFWWMHVDAECWWMLLPVISKLYWTSESTMTNRDSTRSPIGYVWPWCIHLKMISFFWEHNDDPQSRRTPGNSNKPQIGDWWLVGIRCVPFLFHETRRRKPLAVHEYLISWLLMITCLLISRY